MRFLLDTNVVIALLNDRGSLAAKRLRRERPSDVAISSIVVHELYYGAFKSARAQHDLSLVDGLQFRVLEFDREDARQAGAVRALLAGQGKPVGPYDALIAGQALARNLILVTGNAREFERVPGLAIEDWQSTES
jgi:tRNA(fMet)-specific endonuclease VapC